MSFILNFFSGFLRYFGFLNKKAKIVLLGLDNSGKTTLLHVLKSQHLKQPNPTFHPTSEELTIKNIDFQAWDLGGHSQARKIWKDYFPIVDCIVYIVDASDEDRLEESKEELEKLLSNPDLSKIPFLILGNKIDKIEALSEETLKVKLNLFDLTTGKGIVTLSGIRPVEVFMCSIINKEGYGEGFEWISQYIQ